MQNTNSQSLLLGKLTDSRNHRRLNKRNSQGLQYNNNNFDQRQTDDAEQNDDLSDDQSGHNNDDNNDEVLQDNNHNLELQENVNRIRPFNHEVLEDVGLNLDKLRTHPRVKK